MLCICIGGIAHHSYGMSTAPEAVPEATPGSLIWLDPLGREMQPICSVSRGVGERASCAKEGATSRHGGSWHPGPKLRGAMAAGIPTPQGPPPPNPRPTRGVVIIFQTHNAIIQTQII